MKNRLKWELHCRKNWSLLQNTFNLVPDKRTDDEDDEKENYPDEKTGCAKLSESMTHVTVENIQHSKHEDDPKNNADNNTIFQEAVIVFFSLMKKAKGDTQDQVQQFKPHMNTLEYRHYCCPSAKRFPDVVRRTGCEGI